MTMSLIVSKHTSLPSLPRMWRRVWRRSTRLPSDASSLHRVVWPESCAGLEPAPLTRGVHGSAAARSSLRPATLQPQFAVISGLTLLTESRPASSEVVPLLTDFDRNVVIFSDTVLLVLFSHRLF